METEVTWTRQQALAVAERCARLLQECFGARRVIPFGSVIGHGSWHDGSDLDLAVEGVPPDRFWEARGALDQVVPRGLIIDLVPLEEARPELRARILGEGAMSENPVEALQGLIEDELTTLGRVVAQMDEDLCLRSDPPTQRELRSMATLLHEFYTGLESIFERLAVHLGEGIPKGAYWHADLLDQMATPQEGRRPAVIPEPLRARLKAYLDFRHFFRHAYGYDLGWVRLRPLVEGMRPALQQVREAVHTFLTTL